MRANRHKIAIIKRSGNISFVALIKSPPPSFSVPPHGKMKESNNYAIKLTASEGTSAPTTTTNRKKKLTSLRNLVRNARKAMERRTDKMTPKPKSSPICKASQSQTYSTDFSDGPINVQQKQQGPQATPRRNRAYSDDSSINDDPNKSSQNRSFLHGSLLMPTTNSCRKKVHSRFMRPIMNKKRPAEKTFHKHHRPRSVVTPNIANTTDDDASLGSDIESALNEESLTAESSWGVLGNSGDSSTFPTLGGFMLSSASQSALNASLSLAH